VEGEELGLEIIPSPEGGKKENKLALEREKDSVWAMDPSFGD